MAKLVVGLGNPGSRYEMTRHNLGFRVVDSLAQKLGVSVRSKLCEALVGEGMVGSCRLALAKPITFMNESGRSVRSLVSHYAVDTSSDLMVVYDDIDLEPGRIRIKRQGSGGTHNGICSVLSALGTQAVPRLRVGIGRQRPGEDTALYVLSVVSPEEALVLREGVDRACLAAEAWVLHGIDYTMGRFNGPSAGEAEV